MEQWHDLSWQDYPGCWVENRWTKARVEAVSPLRPSSRCKMMKAQSKVGDVVGFWVWLGTKDWGHARLSWTTARAELQGLVGRQVRISRVWRARLAGLMKCCWHRAPLFPSQPLNASEAGLSSHPLHVPDLHFLRALLIFPYCCGSLESDHRLMAWPVPCLKGYWEAPVSRGPGGKMGEEFSSHFSFPLIMVCW